MPTTGYIVVVWRLLLKKILLVNNLPTFLERNASLLDRIGFKLYTATSAREAMEIHREQRVDLIIAKLDMPDMEGDLLCSLIRQDVELRKVSIILICYPTPLQIEKASRCGANAWICRPVQPALLLQEVGKLIDIPTRMDHRARINGIVRSKWFSGTSSNISASGILFETDMVLDSDELILSMSFFIASREIFSDGKIVRSVSMPGGLYNYGVQFIGLAPEYRKEIESYVAQELKARPRDT